MISTETAMLRVIDHLIERIEALIFRDRRACGEARTGD
jgi:hypothetical protein